jgi:anti-anti-sigma factor
VILTIGDDSDTAAVGRIEIESRAGVAVISLIGEHDLATADELRSRIAEQSEEQVGIVISLREAEFIDSAIIHALFQGDRRLLKEGRRLVLHTGGDENIESVLGTAGAFDQLMWSESLDEAVAFAAQRDQQQQAQPEAPPGA